MTTNQIKNAIILYIGALFALNVKAQEKPIKIPSSMDSKIEFSIAVDNDIAARIAIGKTDKGWRLEYGDTWYDAKLIKGKLVLNKPMVLSYDTCRQTITVIDTKNKKSYTIRWEKPKYELTNLKSL